MLMHVEKEYAKSGRKPAQAPVAWMPDGNAFSIRSKEKLVSDLLPQFFRQSKFSSFTRKLYRWGFRQVNVLRDRQPQGMYFGNEDFQRDNKVLLSKMRSITAAGIRRDKAAESKQSEEVPPGFQPQSLGYRGLPGFNLTSMSLQSDASLAALPPRLAEPSLFTLGNYQQSRIESAMLQQAVANAQMQRQLALQHASLQHQRQDPAAGQYLLALSQFPPAPNMSALQIPSPQTPQHRLFPHALQGAAGSAGFPSSTDLQQAMVERERLICMLLRQTHPPPPPR
jgi:hypothetical protein